jgi:hypothetical protein
MMIWSTSKSVLTTCFLVKTSFTIEWKPKNQSKVSNTNPILLSMGSNSMTTSWNTYLSNNLQYSWSANSSTRLKLYPLSLLTTTKSCESISNTKKTSPSLSDWLTSPSTINTCTVRMVRPNCMIHLKLISSRLLLRILL